MVGVVVLVVAGGALLLLWQWIDGLALASPADKDRLSSQLDAIKTASGIAVGGGGLFALYLAARRQRTQELELAQRERAQSHVEQVAEVNRLHAERVAEASESDAAARRVTELYSAAVEQLGSDKAPVRLGGLYALERLAQDNPVPAALRQMVVNVLCAYLRMPWVPPGEVPGEDADELTQARYEGRVQEREVRLTAQRILRDHLHPGADHDKPVATFWAGANLDLTGAALVDFDLAGCLVDQAGFARASFSGKTSFEGARFVQDARFDAARFAGEVYFGQTWFTREAQFTEARFNGEAVFDRAAFRGDVWFGRASFAQEAWFGRASFVPGSGGRVVMFGGASFAAVAGFWETQFAGNVMFGAASFSGDARFARASFEGVNLFNGASFDGEADFSGVSFAGETRFDTAEGAGWAGIDATWSFVAERLETATTDQPARFSGRASFSGASFDGRARFDGVSFAHAADFHALAAHPLSPFSTWPGGWRPADQCRPIGGLSGDWHELVPVEPETVGDERFSS